MGVHGLWDLLSPVGHRVGNEYVQNKVLAIDISIWLSQFVKVMQDTETGIYRNGHLMGVLRRCLKLLFLSVKPVFVFDGEMPAIKRRTLSARREQREKHAAHLRRLAEKLLITQMKSSIVKKALKDRTAHGRTANASSPPRLPSPGVDEDEITPNVAPANENDQNDELEEISERGVDLFKNDEEFFAGFLYEQKVKPGEMPLNLPSNLDDIDDEALLNLPPKLQAELFKQIKMQNRAKHRESLMMRDQDPAAFSNAQIDGFLRNTALNRKIKKARTMINDKSGASRRIASDCARQYVLEEKNGEGEDLDEDLIDSDGDSEFGSVAASQVTKKPASNDILARLRLQRDEKKSDALMKKRPKLVDQHTNQNLGVNWASSVLEDKGELKMRQRKIWKNDSSSDEEFFEEEMPTVRSDVQDDGFPTSQENENIPAKNNSEVDKNDKADSDSDSDMEWEDGSKPTTYDFSEKYVPTEIELAKKRMCETLERMLVEARSGKLSDTDRKVTAGTENSVVEANAVSSKNDRTSTLNEEGVVFPKASKEANASNDDNQKDAALPDRVVNQTKNANAKDANVTKPVHVSDVKSDSKILVAPIPCNNEGIALEGQRPLLQIAHPGSVQSESLIVLENGSNYSKPSHVVSNASDLDSIEKSPVFVPESKEQHDREGNDVVRKSNSSSFEPSRTPSNEAIITITKTDTSKGNRASQNRMGKRTEEAETQEDLGAFVEVGKPSAPEVLSDDAAVVVSEMKSKKEPLTAAIDEAKTPLDEISKDALHVALPHEDHESENKDSSKTKDTQESPPVLPTNSPQVVTGEAAASHEDIRPSAETTMAMQPSNAVVTPANLQSSRIGPHEAMSIDEMEQLDAALENEAHQIRQQKSSHQGAVEMITDEMYAETMDLLRILGIPFLQAPTEAEAQCAFLNLANVVDGVITEDSDVFLFGAKSVFRKLFSKGSFAEVYESTDIEKNLGLSRENLIRLAYLLGSDYTPGVRGVGVVNAMEVLDAFRGNGLKGLSDFKEWAEKVSLLDREPSGEIWNASTEEAVRLRFCWKHRNMKRNWLIREGFPNPEVFKAYEKPHVNRSTEKFSWNRVDFARLEKYCWEKFGWEKEMYNNLVGPVRERLKENARSQQTRIDEFFKPHRFAKIRSERLKEAVKGMAGEEARQRLAAFEISSETNNASEDPTTLPPNAEENIVVEQTDSKKEPESEASEPPRKKRKLRPSYTK